MRIRRALLWPLVPIYGAIVRLKRWMFAGRRLRARSLRGVVISVGSLSAGGAGKTPVVLLLAELLGRRGYAVRILTRGYGRKGADGAGVARGSVERVDAAGDARRFGDEPMLLARRSGVPVYVGADRYRAGMMAEEAGGGEAVVHLLDDGFQHQRLRRELDVVLLTQEDVADCLLPAGNLREPLLAIMEAGVIVAREEEAEAVGRFVRRMLGHVRVPPVWLIRRRLGFAGFPLPSRPVVFCGIARPEGFLGMLVAAGVMGAATVIFGDHHGYGERDVTRLLRCAAEVGADGFVTTEKDAVKLTLAMRKRMERVGPVVAARLDVEFVDEAAVMEEMMAMVPRLHRRES